MEERLLRLAEVSQIVGLKATAIYTHEKAGRFPRRLALGGTSAWVESEIRAWVAKRIANRDAERAEREQLGAELQKERKRAREQGAA